MEDSNHPTLWFQDGNVVLRARSEEGSLLRFRVHQFMLAHHSPVFSDMFTFPNPATADTYEGAPVVDMPDKAEDLECFLRVLYDPTALPYKKYDPDTPLLVTGILRIATKYQVGSLRTRIVDHVKADWPQTLVEWDHLESEIAQLEQAHRADSDDKSHQDPLIYTIDGRYLDQRVPEPAAAIRLAREFDIPSILPAAFYTLARIDPDHQRHPHPIDYEPAILSPWHTRPAFRTARWPLLTTEDYHCLVRGQAIILDQLLRVTTSLFNNQCKTGQECDLAWRNDMFENFEVLPHAADHDILRAYAEFYSPERLRDSDLCWSCQVHHAGVGKAHREDVWGHLPTWFGLVGD